MATLRTCLTLAIGLAAGCAPTGFAEPGRAFTSGKTRFAVTVNGRRDAYAVRSVTVLPAGTVLIEGSERLEVAAAEGTLARTARGGWAWRAPRRPGAYQIAIHSPRLAENVALNAFVLVPYARMKRGILNGYRIGDYPRNGTGIYARPQGFVEVTEANQGTPVSPHFRLKQFLCKQESGFPKYVILNERLLGKLERLLEKVNAEGFAKETLFVMSGYRTPHYNRLLGNVSLSRHLWGDAADVYPERPETGAIEDLNGDGKIDAADSEILKRWIESLERASPDEFPAGGVGVYAATEAHGPFVHVDARGARARWAGAGAEARVPAAVTTGQ